MSAIFDKSLSLEFAGKLVTECLRAGMGRIPIRWRRVESAHRHWSKGHLVGVHGSRLIVRPLNSAHKQDTEISVNESITLWTTKMQPAQVELIRKLKLQSAADVSSKQQRSIVMSSVLAVAKKAATPSVVATIDPPPVAKIDPPPVVQSASQAVPSLPSPAGVKIVPPAPPPTASPSQFADDLNAFLKWKAKLKEDSQTQGIALLKRLFADYTEALAIAANIKKEMLPIAEMLEQVEVPMPSEIAAMLSRQPVQPPADAIAFFDDKAEVLKSSPDRRTRLALELEPRIVAFLAQGDRICTSREILTGIGYNAANPSTLLGPLVARGSLAPYGRFSSRRYGLGVVAKKELNRVSAR